MKKSLSLRSGPDGILARWIPKMAWNEPDKDDKDKKDPWSNQRQDGPPDLDEVVRKMQQKFGGLFGGKKKRNGGGLSSGEPSPTGFYVLVFFLLSAAWLIYDSVYTIQQAERGVVLRFGKYATTIQPGLNFRFPRPIEYVYKVDVKKIYNFADKASMLTQDENIVEVELFIQYQITEPEKFLFDVRWPIDNVSNVGNPDSILRFIMESAVRDVIGKNKMDYVLTDGRTLIAERTRTLMQEILNEYGAGLMISELKLQYAKPPEEVKAAFDDAIKAREDEIRSVNEAEAYRNDVIPKARGTAARDLADANAYKARIIDEARGDASRFEQLLAEYEKAPRVTRDRLYLETIEEVLHKNRKVMIDVEGGNNLMYLPLDRLMQSGAMLAPQALPQGNRIEVPATNRGKSTSPRSNSRTGAGRVSR